MSNPADDAIRQWLDSPEGELWNRDQHEGMHKYALTSIKQDTERGPETVAILWYTYQVTGFSAA